jgi:hypothetical protein
MRRAKAGPNAKDPETRETGGTSVRLRPCREPSCIQPCIRSRHFLDARVPPNPLLRFAPPRVGIYWRWGNGSHLQRRIEGPSGEGGSIAGMSRLPRRPSESLLTELRGKLAQDPLEHPAEVGQVLEADLANDLGDPSPRMPKQLLGPGDPSSRQVLAKGQAGAGLEPAAGGGRFARLPLPSIRLLLLFRGRGGPPAMRGPAMQACALTPPGPQGNSH